MATDAISKAFVDDATLATRVTNAWIRCQADPELSQIFVDIASHVSKLRQSKQQNVVVPEPSSKKRKLDSNGRAPPTSSANISDSVVCFECRDVSFSIPTRKKLKLELVSSAVHEEQGQIRLTDSKSGEVEHTFSVEDIEQAFCLPVPDKAQRQQNYVIVPKGSSGAEQMLFTINEAPDKAGTLGQRSSTAQDAETLSSVTTQELSTFLKRSGRRLLLPNEKEFASNIPQSNRKGEKAYHVKAFRGSKDGYLFFLSTGIFFGFKKPLLFFPFSAVESISYTSVLQRTFNLVITPFSEDDSAQDIEFSMIDQADFAGIDEYVKGHGLNDASMAADRRAKMYNVNKDKTKEANGEEQQEDDGQTELEKAEQQLQDEEDELEEDYEPSGGESDGSGEDSEEDDDAVEAAEGPEHVDDEEDDDDEEL